MRKKLLSVLMAVFSLTMWAQQPKPTPTQFYPGLITVNNPAHISEVNSLLAATYNLSVNDALVLENTRTDDAGYTHYRYQHYYKGLRVEGSTITAHVTNSFIRSFSGSYRSFGDLAPTASLSQNAARTAALNKVNARVYAWQQEQTALPAGELVFFTIPNTTETRLAYKFDIYAIEPLYRAWVFVDALNGDVLFENNRIHHADVSASGNSLYNGNVSFIADFTGSNYRLRQVANGIQTFSLNNGTSYTAATDITSNSATVWSDATGVQAHWGAEKTHAYFLNNHSRNSYNGSGAIIKSYVHYSNNYVNAFWDGSRMTYGDGNGTSYGPLVSLDIVGHEITHGVTEYAANLVYSYESGALNESFSDIFGEAIENYASGTNNWQMGTDIGIGGSGALRSMNNPNLYGDPDTYLGTNWYTGTGDNGGVHYNSGVQNKWFYILSQGESGTNDIGNSYSVTGIGISNAAKIAYRNLTVYLSTNSQYFDARNGAIQSAVDLFGAGSPEVIATTNAWYAVGVGGAYGTISYCTSKGNNASYEWIANVTIGSFSNNSGSASYSNFTNQTVNVNAGQSYSVSLAPGFSGTVYNEYWKIWIDFNADGDFADAGEQVFGAGLSSSTVTGTIAIPASASGTTRMRVSMKYNGQQTACEAFAYGEVEDYTIQINGASGPDTQAPSNPTNLTASSTTQTSTNLSWSASTDNVGVTGYDVYVNGSLNGTTASTAYPLSGLAPSTTYTAYVIAKDAAGNASAASNTVSITTLAVPTNTVLLGSYFETGWDSWADGGSDCSRYSGTRSWEGNYSILIRDNSGVASAMTSPALNLTGYNQVEVEFYFYANSMESNEDFWLRYYNGSTWTTVATYARGTSFNNNTFYVATVTLSSANFNFPTNAQFRFQCDASADNDQIYIDAVTITASNSTSLIAQNGPDLSIREVGNLANGDILDDEILIYPNPASDILFIESATAPDQVSIINLTGQVVAVNNDVAQIGSINVGHLPAGTYVVAIKVGDEITYEKFIKK